MEVKMENDFDKDIMFEDLPATYETARKSLRKRILQSIKQNNENDVYDYEAAIMRLNDLISELAMIELKLTVLSDLDNDIDNEPKLLLD